MDVKLICNQRVVTYIKWQGIKPMDLSDPWSDSLEIIALQSVKTIQGMNPMGLIDPWKT